MAIRVKRLQHKITRVQAKIEQRKKRSEEDLRTLVRLGEKLHRARLISLVGKPNAVGLAFRFSRGGEHAKYNGVPGTLTSIKRTWCIVDIAGQSWKVPIDGIRPFEDAQDVVISIPCRRVASR